MCNNKKYNGWTNYETWRINLELFDDVFSQFEDQDGVTAEQIQELAEEMILNSAGSNTDTLVVDYAMAFINPVNWHEIADTINDELKQGL